MSAFPKPVKGSFKDLVDCVLETAIPICGELVCYRPSKGGAFTIPAVFDEDFQSVDPDTEEIVSTNRPAIGIKLRNLPFIPSDKDQVEIGERVFKVTDVREDGQGGATIFMNEV